MKRTLCSAVVLLLFSFACFGQFYIEYEQNFRSAENSLNFLYNLTSGSTTSVPASPLMAEALPLPGSLPVPSTIPTSNVSQTYSEAYVSQVSPEASIPVVFPEEYIPDVSPEVYIPVVSPEASIVTVPDPVTVVLDPIVITEPVYLTETVIEYVPAASPAPVAVPEPVITPEPVKSAAAAESSMPDANQLIYILQGYDIGQLSEVLQGSEALRTILTPRYRMYRTEDEAVLLKLDTATGAVWQVQYGNDASRPMVAPIDAKSLLRYSEAEESGRYELCPTANIYNFILLDTRDGYSYQVKWGEDAASRARILIGR